MADLTDVSIYQDPEDIYQNVFCNPAFELEGEREDRVGDYRTTPAPTPKPIKPSANGRGMFGMCLICLRGPRCGRGALVVSAASLLLLVALGLTLLLLLRQFKGQGVEGELVSVNNPLDPLSGDGDRDRDGDSHGQGPLPTMSSSESLNPGTMSPHPALEPSSASDTHGCGGVLTDLDGSFSSPNHPGLYPPDSMCVWVIRVRPPALVQIFVSSLAVEGPSPCLFDWLEVQEETEHTAVVTRFCGNVAPPTVNTNSSTVWVTFRSDASITGNGFSAQYRAIPPNHKTCSRVEFLCDRGRCLLPMSVCDGQPHCNDQTDEANCSHTHKECGGPKTGTNGTLSSPNHPSPYLHQQLCTWRISVETGHVIRLSFGNFSLETQDVCEFDFVEVYDGADTGEEHVLGRFCGSAQPPDLTSSGHQMTVVFVADEGVADSGFSATFRAVSLADSTCGPSHWSCSSGECLHPEWLCDGWEDCSDGADEHSCDNTTHPPFISPCEPVELEMCRGLSYNFTSFPNIWLSIADQREAAALLLQYRVLMELTCFQPLRRLLCGMFLPQCVPHGGVLQPCRAVCSSAEQQCSQDLEALSFVWPFNCHLLPDSQDPMECCVP